GGCEVPVGADVSAWNIGVGHVGEAVELAMVPLFPPAGMTMVEVPAVAQRDGLKRNLLPIAHAGSDGVCTGVAVEEVIEGAVLLHDDDDVLDGRGRQRLGDNGRQSRGGSGKNAAAAAAGENSGDAKNCTLKRARHRPAPEHCNKLWGVRLSKHV